MFVKLDSYDRIEKIYWSHFVLAFMSLFFLIALFGSYFTVQPGEVAFLKTFGALGNSTYTEWLHFKAPYVTSVVKMDTKIQKFTAKGVNSSSKDLQVVTTDIALNYRINEKDAQKIYRTIGSMNAMEDNLIRPAIQEVVKHSSAKFTAEQLINTREEVRSVMVENFSSKLERHGIIVVDVNLEEFTFSPEFDQAIEAKVKAQQDALTEKNKLEAEKHKAEQTIVQATAQAEKIKIQTEAINQKGGQAYVQLKAIEKWDGKLPQVQGGQDASNLFLDLRNN